jgi:hypothetical protein
LRTRRDGTGFDEAETEIEQRSERLRMLVEASGEPERIGKIEAEDVAAQDRVRSGTGNANDPELERFNRGAVSAFRVQAEEDGTRQTVPRHGQVLFIELCVIHDAALPSLAGRASACRPTPFGRRGPWVREFPASPPNPLPGAPGERGASCPY